MSPAPGGKDARAVIAYVDLILLTRGGDRFVLYAEGGGRFSHPRFTVRRGGNASESFAALVEGLAAQQLGVEISFLGLVTSDLGSYPYKMVVAAVVQRPWEDAPPDTRLRVLTPAEVRARGHDLEHSKHFDIVWRWYETDSSSSHLGGLIRQAMNTSISYLDKHLSIEENHWGWNQYLDDDSVGVLSTAEGLLAHIHANVGGEFVDKPAETLNTMQNPDGGWQVRRALVGAFSSVSVTESTCACLWALYEMGRSEADKPVSEGIAWLETLQRPDGGWSFSASGTESLVFPTTSAVRVLAKFSRSDAVTKGVAWLRSKQSADGGWGATAPESQANGSPEPAYTGYAMVALLTAGLRPDDKTITSGGEYLRTTFDPDEPEPWKPTSFTALIDPATQARLDFRHFTTPWALAALCLAGCDLSDRVVYQGTRSLLRLQQPAGSWRCGLAAPGDTPLWAIHDALYALRVVLDTSLRNFGPISLNGYMATERTAMQQLAAQLLRDEAPGERSGRVRRNWLQTGWMSALSVGVVTLVLVQAGVFRHLETSSGLHKVLVTVGTIVVAALGAVAPLIVAEEYRIWRNRSIDRVKSNSGD